MPLALIIGAIAVALAAIGVSLFGWRVYGRVGADGVGSVEVGVGGSGSNAPGTSAGSIPWVPIAIVGGAAVFLLTKL